MKVLFISSANRNGEINPSVLNQGISLIRAGLEVRFFGIRGKGLKGYLRNIVLVKKEIKEFMPDVVHAHYVLSGVVAKLAAAKPLVVSLMGSDVNGSWLQKMISLVFARYFWDACIVKTAEMKTLLKDDTVQVIPNGVDMELFRPVSKEVAIKETGWDEDRINILFPSDPARPEKNFSLARKAVAALGAEKTMLRILKDVPYEKTVYYLNASDVVLLTSLWEGSPNIIKEAMACGIPVVSTKVGDVREIFSNTDGCYLVEDNVHEICNALRLAVVKKRTDGRDHITYLNSQIIAGKIKDIYSNLLATR